ncbi:MULTISPECIES: siphovirus ReqiPepy6 Gp37-like family protein [unclassified Enterococcus]|uniref:siphovirus ReqiPepy6 Gp37-like family protein n=1 Tax=unclassified Enterococcus TaxID=2608891 RepID=UPI0013EE2C18|nr:MULTISPECIES: siphovirus ReqiPepy6 Gp37-like family protein [unclassified Enterococcus]
MELEIFTQDSQDQWHFESEKVFDGFKSLTINLNYYTYSDFELFVGLKNEHIRMFVPDTVIYMEGLYFYVDNAAVDDQSTMQLKVSGKSLLGKANDRIVQRLYNKTARPEQIVWDHLNAEVVNPSDTKRRIQYLKLDAAPNLGNSSIQYQNSYGNVAEEIETLCTSYDFGIRETAERLGKPTNKLSIYRGKDVSEVVEFSDVYENLTKAGYQNNNFDESTTALVYGEGEGSTRKSVVVNGEKIGLERKELYVDARDLQQNSNDTNLTDAQYLAALSNRGSSKLAERRRILTLTGEVPIHSKLFELGKDYDLGDTVSVKSDLYNLKKKSTITTIKKTYDSKGLFIEPVFGKETPTVFDILGRS